MDSGIKPHKVYNIDLGLYNVISIETGRRGEVMADVTDGIKRYRWFFKDKDTAALGDIMCVTKKPRVIDLEEKKWLGK